MAGISDAPTQPSRPSSYRRDAPPPSRESSAAGNDHHHHLVSSSGRTRLKRKIFDPSPPSPCKRNSTTYTHGRRRGRASGDLPGRQIPPASTPLVIPDRDSNKAEDNHPIPPTKDQPEKHTTLTRPSPSTFQRPNKKLEEQVSPVIKETTRAPSRIKVPNTGTLNISSRGETRGVSDQAIPSIGTTPYHVANVVDGPAGKSHPVGEERNFLSSCSVNLSLESILQAITKKYGDIAKECSLKSAYVRTRLLEAICKIVQELGSLKLDQLDNNRLHDYYSVLEDAEMMRFNVKWLLSRLDTLREAAISSTEAKALTDEKNRRMQRIVQLKKNLQIHKLELRRLEYEFKEHEYLLDMETFDAGKLNTQIKALANRYMYLATN